MPSDAAAAVEAVYRSDWGRIVATLISLVGDFDLAEECAQEAFATAVRQWEESGVPEFPRAWIVQTARHKAVDRIRRKQVFEKKLEFYAADELGPAFTEPDYDSTQIPDDRLRLIFTCCHPALASEAQVGLTLRTLCGLETDEIARAFLVPDTTMNSSCDGSPFHSQLPIVAGWIVFVLRRERLLRPRSECVLRKSPPSC